MQIIPIAPQLNAQNVNVLTFGDVNQGNANNANTGQAVQQQNTQTGAASQQDTRWTPGDGRSQQGGSWAGQSNDSDQGQVQIIPIAPQLNLQNVNALTFGDVNQGNANNANTGQASQQQNTWVNGGGPRGSKPCESKCDPGRSRRRARRSASHGTSRSRVLRRKRPSRALRSMSRSPALRRKRRSRAHRRSTRSRSRALPRSSRSPSRALRSMSRSRALRRSSPGPVLRTTRTERQHSGTTAISIRCR